MNGGFIAHMRRTKEISCICMVECISVVYIAYVQ